MGRSKLLASILGAALLVAIALTLGVANASAKCWNWQQNHQALYVQTDEPSANHIVVYDRAPNGMLKFAGSYATGGMGGVAQGSAVDPLASQGSLATAEHGRVLLAVNAGSDTLSLFRIAAGDKLLLKQVVPSGGQFPVSITVRGHLVYALNAGGTGSVQGYWLFGNHLWSIAGSSRALGLANTNPPNFLASPGMVGFTPDGSRLIVTTKNSGSMIDVFDVASGGMLSSAPVMNASATPVPFAFSFDAMGRLVVVEAGASTVSTYAINPDDSLTTIGSAPDGQPAACWISMADRFYFVSNAGGANISTYMLSGSGVPSVVGTPTAAAAGSIDSLATRDGRFLYQECGGAGEVLVYRICNGGSLTQIQTVTGLPIPFEGIAAN
jgi:Lactonase, 7-bladed beta-propeller